MSEPKRGNLPHARGDEPIQLFFHPWHGQICPTHVGMNREVVLMADMFRNLPHARGDEPEKKSIGKFKVGDLPHARGDEPNQKTSGAIADNICPTHVGMNRYGVRVMVDGRTSAPRTWG